MQKLNLGFSAGQVMKSAVMNVITNKVDEIVGEVNKLPSMVAATETNKLEIEALKDKEVDIKQTVFDKMFDDGTLDTTKNYYTYEDEEEE